MKKQSTTKLYYVSASIQRLFTYTIAVLYLIQTTFVALSTFNQSQQGSDYRPQLNSFVLYNVVPIIIFTLAYVMNPRTLNRLSKTFEALLITVGGYIGWTIINMLIPTVFISETYITSYPLYEYISAVLFVAIYAFILAALRIKGVWS